MKLESLDIENIQLLSNFFDVRYIGLLSIYHVGEEGE